MNWIKFTDQLPPEGEVVDTKIDDAKGVRNEQALKRVGSLMFFPDGSMYVYYAPTHWRYIDPLDDPMQDDPHFEEVKTTKP